MDYNEVIDLLKKNRSCRRFREEEAVSRENLLRIVDAARYCASGRNLQPLVYRFVEAGECGVVFPLLGWAGYLKEWPGPEAGERPAAYVVQCLDTRLTSDPMCDDGLQLEAMTLAATALGFGCCIVRSFNPAALAEALHIPERYRPLHVVALGRPAERIVIDTLDAGSREAADNAGIYYWRGADGVHHVPKRPLCDLVIE